MASPPTTTTTVRVLSPAAHLLSPTRSASEAELAVRQTLAAALSPGSPSGSPSANGSRPAFSRKEDGTVSVPSVDGLEGEQRAALAGLWAARSELDSTAKLFLPSPSSSSVSSSAAASAVASALEDLSTLLADVQTVDTLVLSWQGVAYEGEELAFFSGKPAAELIGAAGSEEVVDDETVDGMVELWLVRFSRVLKRWRGRAGERARWAPTRRLARRRRPSARPARSLTEHLAPNQPPSYLLRLAPPPKTGPRSPPLALINRPRPVVLLPRPPLALPRPPPRRRPVARRRPLDPQGLLQHPPGLLCVRARARGEARQLFGPAACVSLSFPIRSSAKSPRASER